MQAPIHHIRPRNISVTISARPGAADSLVDLAVQPGNRIRLTRRPWFPYILMGVGADRISL